MTKARIYKPAKNAMQSGQAGMRRWVLEMEPAAPRYVEPLMGWVGSPDTLHQVKLDFETLEEATDYADAHGLSYTVLPCHSRTIRPKSYADNFAYRPPAE